MLALRKRTNSLLITSIVVIFATFFATVQSAVADHREAAGGERDAPLKGAGDVVSRCGLVEGAAALRREPRAHGAGPARQVLEVITVERAAPVSTLSRLPRSSIEKTITGRSLSRASAMAAPSITLRSLDSTSA